MENSDRVAEAVTTSLAEIIGRKQPGLAITRDQRLGAELGVKSLQMAALLTNLCSVLDLDQFSLSDIDIARMKTVGDVIDILSHTPGAA